MNVRVPGFAKKPEIRDRENPRFPFQFALLAYKIIDKYN